MSSKLATKLKMGAIVLKKKAAILSSAAFVLLFIALGIIGWVVFLGGFIAFSQSNGGPGSVAHYVYLPHWFAAIVSPFVLILCLVEAILRLIAPGIKAAHTAIIAATFLLAVPLLEFMGAILHPMCIKYHLDVYAMMTTEPLTTSVMLAGLILESVFMGLALLLLSVAGYLITPENCLGKMEEVGQEKAAELSGGENEGEPEAEAGD